MFGFIGNLFITVFYQPFFNLLVLIYQALNFVAPGTDMGVAVILFTIAFRILWLPMSLNSDRTEREQWEISEAVKGLKIKYAKEPLREKEEIKKLLRSNRRIVTFSIIDICFQVMIALMLLRIFSSGLEGADFHLLYSFMPKVTQPFNLVFMHKFDLSKPNLFLNIFQSIIIFVSELFAILFSPFPVSRSDLTTLITFPLLAFFYFLFMPAGKKLFVITTLSFSLVLMIVKKIIFVYHNLTRKFQKVPVPQAQVK